MHSRASPIAQAVNNLPAMQETQGTRIQSLGGEDPLEEEMATHFGILAWKIPWTEEPGGSQSMRSQRVGHDWASMHLWCTAAAAAAKSASVVSNSVQLHRRQPTRLPRPRDSPGKNTRVGCHFLLQCMKVKSEKWKWSCSVVSNS